MSTVALVRCTSYETCDVDPALERGMDLLGGVTRFARPGESIVLKPNLLVGRDPDRAVTTHPSIFRGVARLLTGAGARLSYGDSPGFGRTESVAGRAGIARAARDLSIPAADFAAGETVSFPEGRLIKQFTIARGVLNSDAIVSIAKLKTHGLTRITGAIKNQFGCIPGPLKAEFHARLPNTALFSQMLVDLNLLLRPRLFVVDGVVAMEGNGPQGGRPRPLHALLLSDDPVALDATICRLVNLDPHLVPTIEYGEAFGLGTASPIDLVGDPIESLIAWDFDVNRDPRATVGRRGVAFRVARWIVVPRPVVRAAQCTRCGTCVRVCPVTPKAIAFDAEGLPPVHRYDRCIRCYCCQELCPEGAIEIEVPPLGRLLHR
ncbi:MAG: DUF362 domain-containing protein [Candidatus Bipolaricaulis sp.]|nr:DUF362 domain-containing protein [Candidatus Bipolaricaulis sp.]